MIRICFVLDSSVMFLRDPLKSPLRGYFWQYCFCFVFVKPLINAALANCKTYLQTTPIRSRALLMAIIYSFVYVSLQINKNLRVKLIFYFQLFTGSTSNKNIAQNLSTVLYTQKNSNKKIPITRQTQIIAHFNYF